MSLKIIWLTGLPCSGKTTLAQKIQLQLGGHILDGDEIRKGLCSDLDFSEKDRNENSRRVGEVAKLINGLVIVALVSPYKRGRDAVRAMFKKDEFIEVWVDCSLKECKRRDVKKMYSKLSEPLTPVYEAPEKPEIHLKTDIQSINRCVNEVYSYCGYRNY